MSVKRNVYDGTQVYDHKHKVTNQCYLRKSERTGIPSQVVKNRQVHLQSRQVINA